MNGNSSKGCSNPCGGGGGKKFYTITKGYAKALKIGVGVFHSFIVPMGAIAFATIYGCKNNDPAVQEKCPNPTPTEVNVFKNNDVVVTEASLVERVKGCESPILVSQATDTIATKVVADKYVKVLTSIQANKELSGRVTVKKGSSVSILKGVVSKADSAEFEGITKTAGVATNWYAPQSVTPVDPNNPVVNQDSINNANACTAKNHPDSSYTWDAAQKKCNAVFIGTNQPVVNQDSLAKVQACAAKNNPYYTHTWVAGANYHCDSTLNAAGIAKQQREQDSTNCVTIAAPAGYTKQWNQAIGQCEQNVIDKADTVDLTSAAFTTTAQSWSSTSAFTGQKVIDLRGKFDNLPNRTGKTPNLIVVNSTLTGDVTYLINAQDWKKFIQACDPNQAGYWSDLKIKLNNEGSQLYENIVQLKLQASDGKFYTTDVADTEQLLRIVQSIPSPKAEPFKQWLAKVGYERIQEVGDPARGLDRAPDGLNVR